MKKIDLGLRPAAPLGRCEFVPFFTPVEIGHRFDNDSEPWRVTWCQKIETGWLLMIVPEE